MPLLLLASYRNGESHREKYPHTPYLYVNVDDVKRVVDQVHEDTIPEAIRPGLMLLDAVLNSSDSLVENDV